MLSVVLVTPLYQETATPAGLCTAALANAFAQSGYCVHVICSMTVAPRPRHELSGRITIHRLETRRASHPMAFAVQATRRIHELVKANRCDAIECIDAPDCVVALAALRRSSGFNAPLIEVVVQHTHAACGLADASVTASGPKITPINIPFPVDSKALFVPNTFVGPVFIACDAITPDDQQVVLEAFKDSNASSQGWSLAIRSANGSWFIHERAKESKAVRSRPVYLAVSNATPIAAIHARRHGHECIVADHSPLADEFPSGQVYDAAGPRALTRILQHTMLNPPVDAPDISKASRRWETDCTIVQAHEQLWKQSQSTIPNTSPITSPIDLWRACERHASTIQKMEAVQ